MEHEKFYEQRHVDILAQALKEAFLGVGCDLRCFDWLSYRPDYYIEKENNNKES